MEKIKEKTSGADFFLMVSAVVVTYKDKQINDIDLYNSILRLVYFHSNDKATQGKLKKVVGWLNQEEDMATEPQKQYLKENVIRNAGDNYFEGLLHVMGFHEHVIKKYDIQE